MKQLLPLLFVFIFVGCQKSEKPSYAVKSVNSEQHQGKKLMETKCYVCHNPSTSHEDRIAPPMIAVKKHYISSNTTKEAFIASMQHWIKNPTAESSKMPGAVKRFGVMPKQYFSEEDIKQISEYMFDNEIDEPEWFQKHYNEQKGNGKGQGNRNGQGYRNGQGKGNMRMQSSNNINELSYSEKGVQYALSTKAVLGKNLQGKIQKEGTLAALKFCNTKAYFLTDSMAIVHNATIKRVSDKPRNPKNKANKDELKYIQIFKSNINQQKESEAIVVESGQIITVYYPITTNGMCLQCHGTPKKEVAESTLVSIKDLYPSDLALGYDINQVRGIWNVSFKK